MFGTTMLTQMSMYSGGQAEAGPKAGGGGGGGGGGKAEKEEAVDPTQPNDHPILKVTIKMCVRTCTCIKHMCL